MQAIPRPTIPPTSREYFPALNDWSFTHFLTDAWLIYPIIPPTIASSYEVIRLEILPSFRHSVTDRLLLIPTIPPVRIVPETSPSLRHLLTVPLLVILPAMPPVPWAFPDAVPEPVTEALFVQFVISADASPMMPPVS